MLPEKVWRDRSGSQGAARQPGACLPLVYMSTHAGTVNQMLILIMVLLILCIIQVQRVPAASEAGNFYTCKPFLSTSRSLYCYCTGIPPRYPFMWSWLNPAHFCSTNTCQHSLHPHDISIALCPGSQPAWTPASVPNKLDGEHLHPNTGCVHGSCTYSSRTKLYQTSSTRRGAHRGPDRGRQGRQG